MRQTDTQVKNDHYTELKQYKTNTALILLSL